MKIVTLLENTAQAEGLHAAHGLSNYLETPKHKLLFDMGPDARVIENAETLGVDLSQVDIAVLSHGHSDHGGGLAAFCRLNDHAKIYMHRGVFGPYYSLAGEHPHYIGLDPALHEFEDRFVFVDDVCQIDDELTLFAGVHDTMGALSASGKLKEKVGDGWQQDSFAHEQDLLVEAEGKTLLFAGCAHMGIVNILNTAKKRLGRLPDAVFGGFHFFQLDSGDPASAALVDSVGKLLLAGDTVYYTGHCTGEYAYNRLKAILGDRLQPMCGGCTEIF